MNLIKSTRDILFSDVANKIIGFVGLIVFARELGVGQLGSYFLFEALLGMLAIPADFGLRRAAEKRISEGIPVNEIFPLALFLKSIPLSVVIIGLFAFQDRLNLYLGADLVGLLIIAIVINESARLMVNVLRGEMRVSETASLMILRQFIWLVLGYIFINLGFGLKSLIYALIISLFGMLFWGFHKSEASLVIPEISHARSLVSFSKFKFLSAIGGYSYNWMDILLIGFFLTQAHVGAYEVAWRISLSILVLSNAVATTIFPQVSDWHDKGNEEHIERIIPSALTTSIYIVVPAFFGAMLLSQELIEIVFGTEFLFGWIALIILVGDKITQAFHKVIGTVLTAIDRPDLSAKITLIGVTTNLLLNILLIPHYGISGAALATFSAALLSQLIHTYLLSLFVHIRIPIREIGWILLSSILMYTVLSLLLAQFVVDSAARLSFVVFLGAAIYLGSTLVYRDLRGKVTTTLSSALSE